MEITKIAEVQKQVKKWVEKFGIEVPIIVIGDFYCSWHHNGIIGLSKYDFIEDLETRQAHKLAVISLNHEWLHFILWHFVGLETPQGYDNILKRMGFYTIQKAYEWKIYPETYPEIASLEKCHATQNLDFRYESDAIKKPKNRRKLENKRKKRVEPS